MRPATLALGLFLAFGPAVAGRAAGIAKQPAMDLWPDKPPGETGKSVGEEKETKKGDVVTSITNVTKPTLTVYRPAEAKDTGVAVVVCPGGGYNNLAWDHEGEQVARWLNSIGVSAFVLKYRVPRRPDAPKNEPPAQALMDAQRALSLVRHNAEEWKIDAKRVGMLGFSAGGHLTAWASTNADKRSYEPVDAADKAGCRPDFAVLIYPGGVLKRGTDQLSPEIRVTSETPPSFFAHAGDDRVSAENSVMMYLALKRAGVPAELHVYATGGHGFGMRPSDNPASTWPKRCEEWLRNQKILKAAGGR